MWVKSSLRQEVRKRGYKRTIALGAIAAGAMVQYDRNHADIQPGIKQYGAYNSITIMNLSTTVNLRINLDFAPEKLYIVPAGTTISVDEITFQELDVTNLSAADALAVNEAWITVAWEPPLKRDRMVT
jgi:hypothetical protein